ncbi:primase and polymerase (DNA-directed) [Cricetulus griseus]
MGAKERKQELEQCGVGFLIPYSRFYGHPRRKTLLHCYEVIPENAVCKLYFDLEFNKLANPGADGKKMVALLIEHVCKALEELYNVHCSVEDVINLDSSTEEKFSRHLIFQLHDVAFKDNTHVGNFVRKILQPALHLITKEDDDKIPEATDHKVSCFSDVPLKQEILETWEKPGSPKQYIPDLSFLVVKNNMGEKCLFVDLGVYTRNRNFRLYRSSKIGKCVALEVAEDNRFIPKQSKDISEENQYFLSSLVSNVRFSDTLRILTCDTSQTKRKRAEYFNSTGTSGSAMGHHKLLLLIKCKGNLGLVVGHSSKQHSRTGGTEEQADGCSLVAALETGGRTDSSTCFWFDCPSSLISRQATKSFQHLDFFKLQRQQKHQYVYFPKTKYSKFLTRSCWGTPVHKLPVTKV